MTNEDKKFFIELLDGLLNKKLKPLQKRLEEVRVDTASTKTDVALMRMKMHGLEKDVDIIKIDVQTIKENLEDVIETQAEILRKMVTQQELKD